MPGQVMGRLLVVIVAVAILGSGSARAQEAPQGAFRIEVWEQVQAGQHPAWRGVTRGSAFFISEDGRALTASHVIYRVRADRRYVLVAIVGREFYGASVVCASELPYDPAVRSVNVPLSRDVAEIQVTRPEFQFGQIIYNGLPYATAHRGPMPKFPTLEYGPEPRVGDLVRVLGPGGEAQPAPYQWSAQGEVSGVSQLGDGTLGFKIHFSYKSAVPGVSGSPVLSANGYVVGLLDWRDQDTPSGTAIGSSALQPACR
jgi:V8-like Glu-specific endopeptidase